MKVVTLFGVSAALSAVLIFAAYRADAEERMMAPRTSVPSRGHHFSWEGSHHGFHGGFGNVWVVEREVPVVVEKETPPPPAAVPLPEQAQGGAKEPRKPYVIGASYSSLPGSCMKLIEEGVNYYYCGGDWYRQEGKQYRAVARKL